MGKLQSFFLNYILTYLMYYHESFETFLRTYITNYTATVSKESPTFRTCRTIPRKQPSNPKFIVEVVWSICLSKNRHLESHSAASGSAASEPFTTRTSAQFHLAVVGIKEAKGRRDTDTVLSVKLVRLAKHASLRRDAEARLGGRSGRREEVERSNPSEVWSCRREHGSRARYEIRPVRTGHVTARSTIHAPFAGVTAHFSSGSCP